MEVTIESPPQPRVDLSRPLHGVVGYLATALLTLILSEYLYSTTLPLVFRGILIGLSIGLIVVAAVFISAQRIPARRAVSTVLAVLCACILALAAANAVFGWVTLSGYGDRFVTTLIIKSGTPFPRWLAGTALLQWFQAAVWDMPVVKKLLPPTLSTAEGYISLMSVLVMCGATLALLMRRWGRLSVALPTLIPVWIMFSAGYVEYYPFIAWFLLALLVWLFEGKVRLEERSPITVGVLAAALPVVYIAFAPLGAILFVAYALRRPREIGKLVATSIAAGLILIRVLAPTDVDDFFHNLYLNMQFNDNETYPDYIGYALFEGSNFFGPIFALSPGHLRHVLYMYLFGGGIVFPFALAYGLFRFHPTRSETMEALRREPRLGLAVTLVAWHVFYLLFYIARLGPVTDIDLFFSTFIVIAYFAGHAADRLIESGRMREAVVSGLTALVLGNASVAVTYLLFLGLPPIA